MADSSIHELQQATRQLCQTATALSIVQPGAEAKVDSQVARVMSAVGEVQAQMSSYAADHNRMLRFAALLQASGVADENGLDFTELL